MEITGIAGKVALVTGAGGGIGTAIVEALFESGAVVAAADKDLASAEAVARRLRHGEARVAAYGVDVADTEAVEALVDRIERELGPIDILVNVAGVLRAGRIVDLTDEDWDATFAVNARGVFVCSRAVARRMMHRRRGSIVTVSSNSALVPRVDLAAYCASKAAASLFTKVLGLELAEYGIRCNIVSPGSTETPMQRELWAHLGSRESVLRGDLSKFRVGIPLGKLAQPRDIASAVLFLLSDQAGHITMHQLLVDGGATLI